MVELKMKAEINSQQDANDAPCFIFAQRSYRISRINDLKFYNRCCYERSVYLKMFIYFSWRNFKKYGE